MAKHFYTARRAKAAPRAPRVHTLPSGPLVFDAVAPKPLQGEGPKLQGGLPPKVRDNSKAFNAYAPVWGIRCRPDAIGASSGTGRVIGRRVTNGTK